MSRRRMLMAREQTRWEKSNIVVGNAVSFVGHNDYLYVFPSGVIKIKFDTQEYEYRGHEFQDMGLPYLNEIKIFDENSNTHFASAAKKVDAYLYEHWRDSEVFTIWWNLSSRGIAIQSVKGETISSASVVSPTALQNLITEPTPTRKPNVYLCPSSLLQDKDLSQKKSTLIAYTTQEPPSRMDIMFSQKADVRGTNYAEVKGWSNWVGHGERISEKGIRYHDRTGGFKYAHRNSSYLFELRGAHSHNNSIRTLNKFRYLRYDIDGIERFVRI